jgi:hypothetical protein
MQLAAAILRSSPVATYELHPTRTHSGDSVTVRRELSVRAWLRVDAFKRTVARTDVSQLHHIQWEAAAAERKPQHGRKPSLRSVRSVECRRPACRESRPCTRMLCGGESPAAYQANTPTCDAVATRPCTRVRLEERPPFVCCVTSSARRTPQLSSRHHMARGLTSPPGRAAPLVAATT